MAIASVLIGITACNKNETDPVATNLEASKSTKIKIGEPVSFKFNDAPQGSTVTWTVIPDKDVKINASGNQASILFANAGNYSVNARYGALTGSSAVSVLDSVYNPGGSPTIVPLTGDQIAITVSKMPDSMGLIGLNLSFLTNKKYKCLNNKLLFARTDKVENDITTYQIEYNGVEIPRDNDCTAGEAHSKGETSFYPIANGESKLVVKLNGVQYTGTITKAGTSITIGWSYTSGITISPLNLK